MITYATKVILDSKNQCIFTITFYSCYNFYFIFYQELELFTELLFLNLCEARKLFDKRMQTTFIILIVVLSMC